MPPASEPNSHHRGQVLVIVGFALTVLLIIAGLVLDYGVWQVQQRGMRNAADGAAQAGVSELAQKPITAQKRLNAATHAMEYLNSQLGLGLPPGQIGAAATHALTDADGFAADDGVPGYAGADHFRINTPVTSDVSCTGQSWGQRAITVHIDHFAPRFLTKLLFGGDQPVNACATASMGGNGYAIAVLKPNSGAQPNSANLTMILDGANTFVQVCGGDVAINAIFGGGPNPPPGSTQDPAFLKFLKPNSQPVPCDIDNDNKMLLTIENPSPPSWSVTSKQVRVEGATSILDDDVYQAPVHLPSYVQIPLWGQTQYGALVAADAGQVPKQIGDHTAGGGTSCSAPAGYDALDPGKYTLIATATSGYAQRWLCPGVYHFVPDNGQQGIQLGSNTTLAGQGVTLVFNTGPNHNQDDSVISVQSGSNLLLNSAGAGGVETPAPWMTSDPIHNVPIAVWIEPTCTGAPTSGSCTASSVFNMGSGSGIEIKGVIFGPTDNMVIAGNGAHHGAGEIWAWTLKYKGGSQLDQTYAGSDEGYPTLVE